MIQRITQSKYAHAVLRLTGWAQGWLMPALLRRRTFGIAFAASLLAVVYWGLIASDLYVSEAHVVIQSTDQSNSSQSLNLGSMLGGGSSGSRADQLMFLDHLLSVDMLKKLDAKLNLRAHYSDWHRDPISRMWFEDTELEKFHRHYLSRISVVYDEFTGIVVIKAQAYDPKTAHAVTAALVEEGERYMNITSNKLAQERVDFFEKQVVETNKLASQERKAMLDFQNRNGLVSPQGTVDNLAAIINRLEAQRTDLQISRAGKLGYLMPDSSTIVDLNLQIAAIEKQIRQEQARLASPNGKTLNSTVDEFQRLQMNADFAQQVYNTAILALQSGRIEASRILKKVSILQSPTEPEYPLEPQRIYNIVVFILIALLIAGIVHMLAAIIRDHKD